jgi:hypothetical protein
MEGLHEGRVFHLGTKRGEVEEEKKKKFQTLLT